MRNPLLRQLFLLFFLVCCLAAMLMGCGGGGNGIGLTGTATGRATLTVTWPEPSRLIPQASNSIRVTVTSGTVMAASSLLQRPAGGGTSSVTFSTLPIGTLTLTASAYPQTDGSGVAQATATIPIVIEASKETPFALTMATTIDHIEIAPTSPALGIGLTQPLTAVAKDATGAVVLTTPARGQWQTDNAAVAAVSSAGIVTGVGAGTAKITYTDTESGKSAFVTVSVRANTSITFNKSAVISVPFGITICSADFDGDGNRDIAVSGHGEIGVLYGHGNGTFDPYRAYSAPGAGDAATRYTADVNNDGRPDIFATDGRVLVFLNQGGRNFALPTPYSFGSNPAGVATGDLNGDGFRDLVIGNFADNDYRIGVLLNRGDGTFGTATSYTVNSYPGFVDAGDIDGDGKVDVVANAISSTVGQSSILVLWGNGNGTLTYGPRFPTGTSNNGDARVVDINGDGKLDLFINNTFDNTLSYVINRGGRTFATPVTVGNVGGYPRQPGFADFNRDGLTEIVVANRSTVYLLHNLGNDLFSPSEIPLGSSEGAYLTTGDFNNDGKPDVVVSDQNVNTLTVFLNITP